LIPRYSSALILTNFVLGSGTGSPSASPVSRPTEPKGVDVSVPNISHINESPHSSVPSTPDDNPPRSGHRRTDSVTIEGEDYFLTMGRFNGTEAKSAPITPQALLARNISFSPRIQFHDTFASGEYDRRGEVATCNRLTPLLAQQIKEELNTFKMVRFSFYPTIILYWWSLTCCVGNGSPRIVQSLHTLLLIGTAFLVAF
jgi:hypothetical protein